MKMDMYNCLKTPTSRFRKLLASLFVSAALCAGAWTAETVTYIWTGDATPDTNWTTAGNWKKQTVDDADPYNPVIENPASTVPGENDTSYISGNITVNSNINIGTIYFTNNTTLTVTDAVTAKFLSMEPAGQAYVTDDFNVKITGSGSLTVDNGETETTNAIVLSRWSTVDEKIGTLEIDTTVECKQRIETHSGTQLLVNSGKTLTTKNLGHNATGGTPKTQINIEGNLVASTKIDLCENIGSAELNNSGTITAATITSTKATYNNDNSNYLIKNTGIITVSASLTIPEFTNGSTFKPYTEDTGTGSIILDGTDAKFINTDTSHAISISTLTGRNSSIVSGGGKTSITTATFNDTAQLNGTTITSALFTSGAILGDTAANTIATATFRNDITLAGVNDFTNITAANLGNNNTLSVTGTQTITGDVSLSGTDANALTVSGTGDLKLTKTLVAEYLNFTGTGPSINADSTGSAYAKHSTGTPTGWAVVDEAQIVWNGGSDGAWDTETNWLPPTAVPTSTDDVIINSGSPKITTAVSVKNISINGTASINIDSGSLTINPTSAYELDNNISGDGTLILASGHTYTVSSAKAFDVNIENQGIFHASDAVTLNKNFTNKGSATFDVASSITGNFANDTSSAANFIGGLSLAGDFTDSGTSFSGTIKLNGSDDQTFKGSTSTPGYDVVLNSSGNIKFTDTLTLNSLDAATNSYAGTITFNGSGAQSFTAQSGQYKKITVNKTSDTLTINGNLQAETFEQDSGNVQFDNDVQVDTYTQTAGNIEFKGNATFTNEVTLSGSATNSITFTGGTSGDPHTISGSTLSLTNLSGDYVTVYASTSVLINGASVSGLGITATTPTVKMKGSIETSDTEDFIIDYPLLLKGDTEFNIGGNIIIKDTAPKVGSINSDSDTAYSLSLQAGSGKSIQIQNGTSTGAGLGTTKSLSTITIKSNLALTTDTIFKTSATNGTIFAETGSLSGSGKLSLTGNMQNTGSWTFNEDISVTGNVTDNGTWASADGKKLIFNGTGNQTFKPKASTTYKKVEVNKDYGNFTAQTSNLNVTDFTLTKCAVARFQTQSIFDTFTITACNATTFNGESTFTTFTDATTGTITFANDTTIKSNTEFQTEGTVSFNGNKDFKFDSGTSKYNITHSAGTTNITGTLTAATVSLGTTSLSGAITASSASFDVTTVSGDTSITTGAGETISFTNTVTGTAKLQTIIGSVNFANTVTDLTTLTTDATATFNANVSVGSLLAQNAIIYCESITTTGAQTYDGTVSLLKDGNITLSAKNSSNEYQTVNFNNIVDCSGATGTQNLIVDAKANISCASITTSGTQEYKAEITISNTASAVSLEGSTITFKDKITGGTGNQGLTLNATTTTFGDGAADSVTALASLAVTGNTIVNTNTITTIGDQTYTGTTQFNSAATVTSGGVQNYTDTITLNSDVRLKAESSSITFGTNISGDAKTLTVNSPELISSIAAPDSPANINLAALAISRDTQIGSTYAAGINLNVSSVTGTTKTLTFAGNTTLFTLKAEITVEPDIITNKSITCAGEATFEGNVNNTSSINCTGTVSFGKTVTNSGTITCNSTATFKDNFTNTNGFLSGDTTGTATLTFEKDYSGTGTSSLTASKGETIFYGNADLSSTSFAHSSGTVSFKATSGAGTTVTTLNTGAGKTFNNLKLERLFTVSGTGTNTIGNLVIKDSVSLLCNNTVTNFTANTTVNGTVGLGGKTITFGAGTEQIVTNLLSLKGSANMDGNRLMLRSSIPTTTSGTGTQWKIKCTGANAHVIQYVDVQDSLNKSETVSPTATAYNLFALDSLDHGNNTKWNFPGMKYEWSGATNTSWTDAANWKYLSIPGKGADIDIPAGCTNYPILITDLDLNETYNSTQYNGKITIKPEETGKVEGKLDLADCNLTLGEITNNGRIRLAGKTGQAIFGTMKNGADSTVEYYGVGSPAAVTQVFAWDGDNGAGTAGKQYENLIINNTINNTSSASADLKVAKNLTINGETTLTGSIEVAGNLTVNQNTNVNGTNVNGTNGTIAVTGASVINCSAISTTGNQTYNGTVSLNKTGDITLTAKNTANENQTLQFNGNVSCDTAVTPNLIINANTKLTCANVTSSGSQTYNGSLQIDNPAAIISQTDSLIFNDNVSLAADLSLTANAPGKSINFAANISDNDAGKTVTLTTEKLQSTVAATISLATLTLSQATTIGSENASSLNLNVNTINGASALTFGLSTTTFTLKDGITINPPVIIETGRAVTCAGAASFNSTMTNNGSLSGDTSAAGKTLTFAQNYTSTTATGGNLTASSGSTVFRGNVNLASTNFNHSNGRVNFNGNGGIQTLATQTDGSTNFYNILISSPAKVSTASSFTVSGTSWSNTTTTDGFTATAGTITFNNGTATAAAPVTVSGKNKFHDVVCKTTNQNITFTSENSFSHNITIGDSGNVPNNVNISSASALTFAPKLYCNNLKLNSGTNAITFTSDSFFNTSFSIEASGLLTFNGDATYGNSFINWSTAITNFKKSFTGSGNATFAGDITLTDDADRSFSTSAGHSITTAGNFIVNTVAANTIQLNTTATSSVIAHNFVLYSGAITLNGKLESTGDIILLGSDYATADLQTGIDDIYLYNQTRPSAVNYTAAFIAAPYNGELTALEDAKIKAGKNFYSNGITLTGPATGIWNIQLPKVSDSHKGFAEAIKTTVSNCAVSCWEDSSNTATDDTAPAKIVAYECTDNSENTNWNFDDFEILNAWTERDDAIFVEFNAPVRNLYNEITNSLTHLTYQGTTAASTAFTGIYSAPDCQDADHIANADIELTNGSYSLYLKAPDSWNTDATGKTAGTGQSSDRTGNHKASVPYLDIPRSLTAEATGTSGVNYIITNKWGKRLNNYSTRTPTAGFSYGTNETAGSETYVLDKTGPVLWSVRTGQELHTAYNSGTGEASQHSYDSHNFLEFRYSEAVDIGSITAYDPPADPSLNPNLAENVQVSDSLGAILEGITSPATSLTFAGLAKLTAQAGDTTASGSSSQLQLYTGSNGSANKYMNALYRPDPYAVRLSVAGWTDGTLTDYTGNEYKKWAGYIEEASQFTGAKVTAVSESPNTLVKDQEGNAQIEYAEGSRIEPTVLSDTSGSYTPALLPTTPNLYSQWDLSSPVFTPLRFSKESEWGDQTMSEAIGNTNGSGSTLDRIDFHFFDNTPTYGADGLTDPAEWFTEIGWCLPGSDASKANLKDASYTYCADIIGGARQFDSDAGRRTTGGIRFSTKAGIAPAFKYSTSPNNPSPSSDFVTGLAGVHTTVVSQLFTGSSSPMRPANDPDGLYLGLGLTDTSLSVETTFAFSYNEAQGYLTDLAGNRLRSKVSKTIDRTPPSFDVIISPVDTKSIYIIFVKELVTDISKIKFRDNNGNPINLNDDPDHNLHFPDFYDLMANCFRIISIDGAGNAVESTEVQIDKSIPAEIVPTFTNDSFTCLKLTTTSEIDIEQLKNLYVQLVLPESCQQAFPNGTTDPLTSNTNSRVTFIQDYLGNYMSMYSAHALSDFAINYVNPLYAYSSDMLYEDSSVMDGLYEAGSWAVHYWNADQNNYGTLPAEHPVSIVADTKGNEKIRVYLSPSPDADSVSKQFNSDFSLKLRVWLPDLQDGIFRALSASNNTNFVYSDGQALEENSENTIFNLTKETVSAWKNGAQISFMFGLSEDTGNPVRIYSNPYYDIESDRFNLSLSIPVPLYCLRMPDSADISTLDLWSFKVKGVTAQRGGVTILNNVINASHDEKTVVVVNMPEDGNLTVCVMTLDGNIITYLNRGSTKAGEYYYTWNGKNKNGKAVARGMYFVRVLGGGIDETRKVMVVKD